MKFLISYTTTDFKLLKDFWSQNDSFNGLRIGSNKVKPDNLGGMLEVVDIDNNTIILRREFNKPLALFKDAAGYIFCALSSNEIVVLDNSLQVIRVVKSPVFNSIHSIDEGSQGMVVSSSGIDAIVGISNEGTSQVMWSASESGKYALFPDGNRRFIDYKLDHSTASYPTLQQTTHINSAAILDNENIIATLFHQGELIKINLRTKQVEVLLDKLHSPHGAHVYSKHGQMLVICSDTLNGRVYVDVAVDKKNVGDVRILEDNFNWVQDAKYYPEENIIVVLDSNNHRVCLYNYDNLKLLTEYKYNVENRIFDIIKM